MVSAKDLVPSRLLQTVLLAVLFGGPFLYLYAPGPGASDSKSRELSELVVEKENGGKSPALIEKIADIPIGSAVQIPVGYHGGLTISVPVENDVRSWGTPGARADITWTYTTGGQKRVATIVTGAKILSIGHIPEGEVGRRDREAGRGPTVTLLTTNADRKRVEVARSIGALDVVPFKQKSGPDVISENRILVEDHEPERGPDAVMETTDPKTGKRQRLVLQNHKWRRE